MPRPSINAKLRAARDRYLKEITHIAKNARAEVIIPFCDEHNLQLLVGNGTFALYDGKNMIDLDNCKLRGFKRVAKTIDAYIPYYDDYAPTYAGGLGSFMEEYTPTTFRTKYK